MDLIWNLIWEKALYLGTHKNYFVQHATQTFGKKDYTKDLYRKQLK